MLKKFKSLFVIEDADSEKEEKTSADHSSSETRKESAPFVFKKDAEGSLTGQVQEKFLEVLFGALSANNQEGFDYMEFKDFLKSLANVPMDDSTRYKSAFATAQTMGATKEKILSSAQHYISILAKEQSKFQEALEGQKQRNLHGKQDEIKNLGNAIDQKEKEIEKLKADIEAHRQKIATLEQEISTAGEKLQQTAGDFNATYTALVSQIESDVQNIQTHL